MIEIVAIDTPSLGDRGYLATDGTVALVIDAQRDFDRVLAAAEARSLAITHVFETHMHNDYVTGGFALAAAVGAQYVVNAADPVSFQRTAVADGDLVKVGDMRVRALATPGHTFTHLSYLLADGDQVVAAFTGGSLLNGTTGRTDLLGPAHKRALARAQFGSAHRLAAELPDTASICPTHGFGSFCSATPAIGGSSTIGDEKRVNPALTKSETEYVEELIAGLDVYPAYYAHMGKANLAGPAGPDLSPPRRAEAAELRRRIDAGEWVVDLRSRIAFAAGHLRGALNFENGANLATYLGWLIPWGSPLTLIGDSAEMVTDAQRELCRIGIDRIEAMAGGPPEAWAAAGEQLAEFPTADFATLAARTAARGSPVVLDVRRRVRMAGRSYPGCCAHSAARALGPDGRDTQRADLGSLRGWLPGRRRRVPAGGGRPPGSCDQRRLQCGARRRNADGGSLGRSLRSQRRGTIRINSSQRTGVGWSTWPTCLAAGISARGWALWRAELPERRNLMPVRRLNHAVLYVRDLAASVDFYTGAFGFEVRLEIPGRAAFLRAQGSANDHDLGLFSVPDGQLPHSSYIGLYHLAWEVGTLAELAEVRDRLAERNALVGASDHRVSKSLYAKDPNGIEFEVMWRVPAESWEQEMASGAMIGPLDLDGELARWGDRVTGAAAGSVT